MCVPVAEPAWEQAQDLDDLPQPLLDEIAHFFAVYKTPEPGKGTTASGWDDRATAVQELQEARRRAAASGSAAGRGPRIRPSADRNGGDPT
jgi:inorganic pyrophosphatase